MSFDFKDVVFLGAGESSEQDCRTIHERLEEGLNILSALQQPSHPEDEEHAHRDREDRDRLLGGLHEIVGDLVTALTGPLLVKDPEQHVDISRCRIDRSGPREFMNFLLIHALAHHAPKDPELKKVLDAVKAEDVKVEFRIAGVPISFERVLYRMNDQLDRMIEESAAALLRERVGDTLDTFNRKSEAVYEAMDALKAKLEDRAREVFPLARKRS